MVNKVKYFNHSSGARNETEMIKLRMHHGMMGYGLYWAIIELLRESPNAIITKDYEAIAWELQIKDSEIVRSIIEDYGLFVVREKMVSANWLSDLVDKENAIREKQRKGGRNGANKRWKGETTECSAKQNVELKHAPKPELLKFTGYEGKTPKNVKKTPKPPRPDTEIFNRCKDIYISLYIENKGEDYYWTSQDSVQLKQLIKKIQYYMPIEKRESVEAVCFNFDAFISAIFSRSDDWIKSNATPSIINSKFNIIYTQLKNKTRDGNKQSASNDGNARDNVEFITRIADALQPSDNK